MAIDRLSHDGLSTPPSRPIPVLVEACMQSTSCHQSRNRVHSFEHLPQHTALSRQSFGNEKDIE